MAEHFQRQALLFDPVRIILRFRHHIASAAYQVSRLERLPAEVNHPALPAEAAPGRRRIRRFDTSRPSYLRNTIRTPTEPMRRMQQFLRHFEAAGHPIGMIDHFRRRRRRTGAVHLIEVIRNLSYSHGDGRYVAMLDLFQRHVWTAVELAEMYQQITGLRVAAEHFQPALRNVAGQELLREHFRHHNEVPVDFHSHNEDLADSTEMMERFWLHIDAAADLVRRLERWRYLLDGSAWVVRYESSYPESYLRRHNESQATPIQMIREFQQDIREAGSMIQMIVHFLDLYRDPANPMEFVRFVYFACESHEPAWLMTEHFERHIWAAAYLADMIERHSEDQQMDINAEGGEPEE